MQIDDIRRETSHRSLRRPVSSRLFLLCFRNKSIRRAFRQKSLSDMSDEICRDHSPSMGEDRCQE